MSTALSLPYQGYSVSVLDRDPPGQRPLLENDRPGQRPPTETPSYGLTDTCENIPLPQTLFSGSNYRSVNWRSVSGRNLPKKLVMYQLSM